MSETHEDADLAANIGEFIKQYIHNRFVQISPEEFDLLAKICLEMFESGVKFAENQTVIVKPNRKIRRAK